MWGADFNLAGRQAIEKGLTMGTRSLVFGLVLSRSPERVKVSRVTHVLSSMADNLFTRS